jgi:hypothetical protein
MDERTNNEASDDQEKDDAHRRRLEAEAAWERITRRSREILARRGGKPFDSSVDVIREMREERSEQL